MKADVVNPFIEAVHKFMEIVGIDGFERQKMTVSPKIATACDVSAAVDVTGSCRGILLLGFNANLATEMLSRLYGEEVHGLDVEEDRQRVGRMMDIIVGNSSREMARARPGGVHLEWSIIFGKGRIVRGTEGGACLSLSFLTRLGEFAIHAGIEYEENAQVL
jgi:CheY-specific phosphatase CheX